MRPVRIFREFNDGFVLVTVRQFLSEEINKHGEYDPKYSSLPQVDSVMGRLRDAGLVLAKSPELLYFKRVHPWEFLANRVYVRANNGFSFCLINKHERIIPLNVDYNCAHEHELLVKENLARATSWPLGYSGELCFLAIRPSHAARLIYRG
ncbi:MAG: hypothetical protein WC725_02045 [Patescibacteria group bacterium]|jgi:hypothetical protein